MKYAVLPLILAVFVSGACSNDTVQPSQSVTTQSSGGELTSFLNGQEVRIFRGSRHVYTFSTRRIIPNSISVQSIDGYVGSQIRISGSTGTLSVTWINGNPAAYSITALRR